MRSLGVLYHKLHHPGMKWVPASRKVATVRKYRTEHRLFISLKRGGLEVPLSLLKKFNQVTIGVLNKSDGSAPGYGLWFLMYHTTIGNNLFDCRAEIVTNKADEG